MAHLNTDRDNVSTEFCDYQRKQDERPLVKVEKEVDKIDLLAKIIVDFISWSFLWPVMFLYRVTIAIWKAIFYFWADFISKVFNKTLPDFKAEDIGKKIHHTAHHIEETVEPILSLAKYATVRLVAVSIVFTIILVSSVVFYTMFYWMMIPKLIQEMPINFSLQTPHSSFE
jgi:hypothetical protein